MPRNLAPMVTGFQGGLHSRSRLGDPGFRILRAVKNRAGATDGIGVFAMTEGAAASGDRLGRGH